MKHVFPKGEKELGKAMRSDKLVKKSPLALALEEEAIAAGANNFCISVSSHAIFQSCNVKLVCVLRPISKISNRVFPPEEVETSGRSF